LLHGTGADEHDLINLGKAIAPNANLLSVRGLVSENGMARFFKRYPDGTFDEESIVTNVNQLAEWLMVARDHYGFDCNQLVAVGFSNGANTAEAMLLMHPELLSGVVAFGATKPFAGRPYSPNLSGKRVWIANGEHDPYAPLAKTQAFVSELTELGAEAVILQHSGGHNIVLEHVQEINRQLS
jgi:predicted esterase